MALRDIVPALPEVFIFPMKERGNQIILGSKMAIEAGFGNTGFFHDKIHAHSPHALAVEEGRRGFEDALSHIHCAVGQIGGDGRCIFSQEAPPAAGIGLTRYRPVRIIHKTDRSVSLLEGRMSAQSGTSRGSLRHVAVFGASGHTGRFVVAELLRRGFTPIPVGRDASRAPGFQDRGMEYRTANVEDPASLDRALAGAAAVINCAGPFLDTAEPLVAAALRARVHYL